MEKTIIRGIKGMDLKNGSILGLTTCRDRRTWHNGYGGTLGAVSGICAVCLTGGVSTLILEVANFYYVLPLQKSMGEEQKILI